MKKLSLFFLSTLGLLAPVFASAHVKWFAEDTLEAVRPYRIDDDFVRDWIVVTIIIIAIGIFLEKKLKNPKWLENKIPKISDKVFSVASMGFGLAFILFSINGFVFAPNLHAGNAFILILQGLVGFSFLFGLYPRIGGILLLALFALASFKYGIYEIIDATEMLGIAIFMIIVGKPNWKITESLKLKSWFLRMKDYAVPALRIGTGLNLMILGFTEKILYPGLTYDFLSKYNWNFMQNIGFEHFTDYWFGFSAGITEFIIGLMLVLGLCTRITTIALAVFLGTTMILLGPKELLGHLPHFSIAIVLLVMGAGNKFKLFKN